MKSVNATLCFTIIFVSVAHIIYGVNGQWDPCDPNPCKNGGNCTEINSANNAVCSCPPGYESITCETAPKAGSTALSDGKICGIVVGCLLFVIMLL